MRRGLIRVTGLNMVRLRHQVTELAKGEGSASEALLTVLTGKQAPRGGISTGSQLPFFLSFLPRPPFINKAWRCCVP